MTRREPLPPHLRSAPFSVGAAMASGVSPSRLRASDLATPFRGTRIPRGEPTPTPPPNATPLATTPLAITRALCLAYFQRLAPGHYFSHVTAAQLYGMPLSRELENDTIVNVTSISPAQSPRMFGVRGHKSSTVLPLQTLAGLPVLDPAFVWCQLASIVDLGHLVAAGDHLVKRKYPQSTLASLADAVALLAGSRGAKATRLALARVRPKTDSPMETALRLLIVDAGLPEPRIGHAVIDRDGYFVATPDLAYVAERIAIEYEGSIHQSDARVYAEDIDRRERLEDAGWLVIRVIAKHVFVRPEQLVARIAKALRTRG